MNNINILVIGAQQRYLELQQKGLPAEGVHWRRDLEDDAELDAYQLVIDLDLDEHLRRAGIYARYPQVMVLGCIVRSTLAALMGRYAFEQGFNIVGCNWLPGFINMPQTEISLMDEEQEPVVRELLERLGWRYTLVQDEVGMVIPRVVCMIINEAYYTAEEGTASREDIDISMRLGTNYPYGPFEWCERIGIRNVYEVLAAVLSATGDERYEVSPMLAAEAGG
ncbi:hypothetical protein KTO58_22750 [Chitinophaga pendula]|uniref:3-hydroxyacyl-CoA dehydrogenase family protein n=1 Tax=Chitinophaga TaxID=79328 RepID=UPI000BAE8C51|nr:MULTISPECIES: 3-hydroxyacyl-CoA dehydrogenase family protein [Chitinophaga]ASZ10564.1 3-hydroxyacyl-CoA dehydrogenase [Chitinophaga sp. MD30]UCJ06462.1 hypothetical protein KTO58_22750 [Chitinophaga pendula]